MFIDISTYVGHWPFRNLKYNSLNGLDELAQRYGITHMVVANLHGLFYKDANTANLELLEELKNYKGKTTFLPMAIVNPTYICWEKDARDMIAAGFAGFELTPLYHGYKLGMQPKYDSYLPEQVAAPVMELAKELDVPVRICSSFENIRGRGRMDVFENVSGDEYFALLSKYPEVSVLCTNFSPLAGGEKFKELIKQRDNIYFDINECGEAQVYGIPDRILQIASMKQMCFGSLSPFDYMELSLINMEYASAYDANAMKVNGARAFKSLR